jgi:hypothetical protein
MSSTFFLIFTFLLQCAHAADLEEVSGEKAEALKLEWKQFQKEKRYSEKELLALLKKGYSVSSISAQHKPLVKGKKVFAVRDQLIASISKDDKETSRFYGFRKCEDLLSLFRKNVATEKLGSPPYVVVHNDYFITHDGKELSDSFRRNCESRVGEENSYECPEYTWSYAYVKAKAGPLLVLAEGSDGGGGCGPPYHSSSIRTIDLRSNKDAIITDFFGKDELLSALKEDPAYGEYLKQHKLAPTRLAELSELPRPLQGFAIYDLKLRKDKVRIRWAWSEENCGMCPNGYEWLGLDVKPKDWFLAELKKLGKKVEMAP